MEEGDGTMAGLDCGSSAQRDENVLEPKHSIFLSHSGAQKGFVEQLCVDIEAHDRYPFFDKQRDSLPIGCNFPELIFEAIKQCEVAVVVLSEEFFSKSKWPMLELAALVKRKSHDPKLIIMPVFLGMTLAQCRERGNHGRWSRVWRGWAEEDNRVIVEDWEAALKVFRYTNGILLSGSDEMKCRQEIVDAVCREVRPKTRRDDSHVQGRSRLCDVLREKIGGLRLSKSYGVQILGIYGVGGIGKSTACMALCNYYLKEFEGRVCHVEFGDGSELQMLHEVLKRLTDIKHELIENLNKDECKDRIKRAMKNQRVLLAIDNVFESHQIVDQAKDMLRGGFGEGSLAIVTARSLGELLNLSIHESECIEMPELLEEEAMSLFLYHAAPGLHLRNVGFEMEQLLRQCVKRCCFGKGDGMNNHYHPLALKVLGGQVGNDPKEWLRKLEEIDPFNQYREKEAMHPIFSILRRSFDTLNDEDHFLFMDVAIFYPERSWRSTTNLFEWLSMVHVKSIDAIVTMLKGLKRKSVVENLGDGSEAIGMHDLWREFAVMKAKAGDSDPRPWIYEKIYGMSDRRRGESCLSGGGWESLQRICMVGDGGGGQKCVVKEISVSCCSNLRVLKLVNVYLETGVLDVSSLKHLKSLEVHYNWFKLRIRGLGCLRNLVYLELVSILSDSQSDEISGLTSLNVLYLRCLTRVAKLPDLSRLNLLQDVVLTCCLKADIISGLSSRMTNLKRLNLSGCSLFRSCHGVGDFVAVEELDLSGCARLEELPSLGRLKNLLKLHVSRCELIEAVPGLRDLVFLQVFAAERCSRLAELPDMRGLVSLRVLQLRDCPLMKAILGLSDLIALEELSADYDRCKRCHDLRKLTTLETVSMSGWSAEGLPCLSDLVNLKSLEIDGCRGVDELTGLLNLTGLEVLSIQRCGFKNVQCLSNVTALTRLDVYHCDQLERLPDMHRLTRLEGLSIIDCKSLREWKSGSGLRLFGADLHVVGTLLQIQKLDLCRVGFTELPDLSSFPQLRELDLFQCVELTSLSSSAPLTALQSLALSECGSLRSLPDLGHLVSLIYFTMGDCGVLLTTHEIEEVDALCPGLVWDLYGLSVMELERDAKRLKS